LIHHDGLMDRFAASVVRRSYRTHRTHETHESL
jgi:hypothetical protein